MQKVKIITQSGQEFEVEVESYDPVKTNEDINNNELITVLIGNLIFARIDIKNVFPI